MGKTNTKPPHKAYQVEIRVDGHDLMEIEEKLRQMIADLPLFAKGGWSSGQGTIAVQHDPNQTKHNWHVQQDNWVRNG